jgi:hypothetical protein
VKINNHLPSHSVGIEPSRFRQLEDCSPSRPGVIYLPEVLLVENQRFYRSSLPVSTGGAVIFHRRSPLDS